MNLQDLCERIVRDAIPATDSGATCFVPRYQIDQLREAMSAPQAPDEAQPDPSFAEWLATEMPAGTVIGDPAWWANRIARQYAKRRSPAEAQAQGGGEVRAKPLEWHEDGPGEWCDRHHGFHITQDDEEPQESRFTAEWGECDPERFSTLEEAQAWCQEALDRYIREWVAPAPPSAPPRACSDPDCGCMTPAFTEPMEALRFLSGRMKFAGISDVVARSYARDIDAILAQQPAAQPTADEPVDDWEEAWALFEKEETLAAQPGGSDNGSI